MDTERRKQPKGGKEERGGKEENEQTFSLQRILDGVLARVRPDPAQEEEMNSILSILTAEIDSLRTLISGSEGVEFTIHHVGSTAKGTHLNHGDLDIFLGFDTTVPRETLHDAVLAIGTRIFPDHEMKYAEHPYIRGTFRGWEVDLVPCYRVERGDRIMSAVDRTPFHTRYVSERLDPRPELRDEVRLLKQFLKGIGCYGAENRTMGFSGYLCELLVLAYGRFTGVLEAVSGWKEPTVLDLEGTGYMGPREETPLLVVDPVDAGRNVASPVSRERIGMFIHASRAFLSAPAVEFFFPPPPEPLPPAILERERSLRGEPVVVAFQAPDVMDDILYPQLRLTVERLETLMEGHGFELNDSGFTVSGAIYLYLEPRVSGHSGVRLHRGPTVYNGAHEQRFLHKWRGLDRQPFLIRDRWFVLAPVKFRTPRELLEHELPTLQTGRHVMEALARGYRILGWDDIPVEVLSLFLDRRMPWERHP